MAIVVGVALAAGGAGILALRGEGPTVQKVVTSTPEAVAPPKLVAAAPSVTYAQADAKHTTEHTEVEIMTKLRELGGSNPALTLELARQGNQRFKHGADAPERASDIVKALLNMDRREQARTEALKMEAEYPGSSWTDDVHRHMFVNPPTHPTERGYGKKYELE
jgi:hypothetical protein